MTYSPREFGKHVIKAIEAHKAWFGVNQVHLSSGLRGANIRRVLDRLVDDDLVEKRQCIIPQIVYPEQWNELGDYAKRQWRKHNNMPHRFQRQYEYRIRSLQGLRGKTND